MESFVSEKIVPLFASFNPAAVFFIIFFVGLILFWRGSIESRRNRSSVFDIFFISSIFALIIGRIVFIFNNWNLFSGYIWYWLPYERYGDSTYFFRLLPWRFLNVLDGGIEIFQMFIAFVLAATIAVLVIKKWRWRDMYYVIFFTAETMLALAFLFSGLSTGYTNWVNQAVVLLIPVVLIFLINGIFRKRGEEGEIPLVVFIIFLINISSAYILYIYLSKGNTIVDIVSAVIFLIWVIFATVLRIRSEGKSRVTIERVSSVRTISPIDIKEKGLK